MFDLCLESLKLIGFELRENLIGHFYVMLCITGVERAPPQLEQWDGMGCFNCISGVFCLWFESLKLIGGELPEISMCRFTPFFVMSYYCCDIDVILILFIF